MEALCHPAIKLISIMPINCEHGAAEQLLRQQQQQQQQSGNGGETAGDDNTRMAAILGEVASSYPMLVGHMMHRTEMELVGRRHWTFRDILEKMLNIAGLSVKQTLREVSLTSHTFN